MKRRDLSGLAVSFLLLGSKGVQAHGFGDVPAAGGNQPFVARKKIKNRIRFKKDMFVDQIEPGVWSISVGLQALGRHHLNDITVEAQLASDPYFSQDLITNHVIVNAETGYRAKSVIVDDEPDVPLYIRFYTTQVKNHKTTGELLKTEIYSEVMEIPR